MAEDKQEKGYEVKDKRRVKPDGSLKEDAEQAAQEPLEQPEEPVAEVAEEQEAEASPAHEEHEDAGAGGEAPQFDLGQLAMAWLTTLDLPDMLQVIAGILGEKAWQSMGLHLPPGQKEPIHDMAQAKLAIDTVIFINDKLHPHLDEDRRRALRSLVSDLQLNFVQHGQ